MLTLPVMAARRFDKYGILHFQDISRYRMPEQNHPNLWQMHLLPEGFYLDLAAL